MWEYLFQWRTPNVSSWQCFYCCKMIEALILLQHMISKDLRITNFVFDTFYRKFKKKSGSYFQDLVDLELTHYYSDCIPWYLIHSGNKVFTCYISFDDRCTTFYMALLELHNECCFGTWTCHILPRLSHDVYSCKFC